MHEKPIKRRCHPVRSLSRIVLVGAVLLLGACSEGPPAAEKAPAQNGASAASRTPKVAVARGKIEVEGGLIEMAPASSGIVVALPVHEGQAVATGAVLLRLDDGVGAQTLGVAESEARLAQEKVRAAQARVPALAASATRYGQAASEGATSRQLADAAQQRLADARADVSVAQAEQAVAVQRLEMAKAVQAQRVLQAPEAGTVVSLLTQRGAFVQAGAQVLTLLPDRPLIVRAELNAAYVDAVSVGMQATVVPDMDGTDDRSALPKARVIRISPMYGHGRLQEEAQRGPVRVVECVLAFDSVPNARVGENVRVIFHE